jgi:phosphodiesterase/alkaline phosphatase D-like protein
MTASFTAAFPNGVSSGDVTQTSAVVWARAVETGRLTFQIATDPSFHHVIKTKKVFVDDPFVPEKVEFEHLKPGTQYFYRAIDASGDVIEGTFETAAKLGTHTGLHFGVVGDWRSDLAPFVSIKNAAAAGLDLVVKLGDTVYADQPPPPAATLAEFRLEHSDVYSSHLGVNFLADLQATTSVLSVIDDHEVTDDFAGGAPPSSDPRFAGQPGDFINETPLYANGLQAFSEFNAIEKRTYHGTGNDVFDGAPDLYRYNTYGSDAAIIMVDARTFRDTEVPAPANPLNPAQVGQFLIGSFDPSRTMLGDVQLDRLKQDLLDARDNDLTWKFVMLPEPIQNFGPIAGPGDRYEGYAAERNALLKFIAENHIENVVFVSTDMHWLSVNNLTYQDSLGGPQIASSAFEVVAPAVASNLIGPLVAPTAAALGLISAAQLAFYNSLPNAPDTDNLLNDKDDFVEFILNQVIAGLGYDPIGLDNNLPIAAGAINATLLQGDYFVGHDFGWTDFDIDATTGELLVTTYGVPGYTDADVSGNPAAVLALNPTIVSQFEVTPTSDSIIGTARNDDLHGTNGADVILGAAGNDDMQGRDGDDYLDGGKGNDDVRGGAGNDRIFGRDGNDELEGQDGNDLIDGGQGNDELKGGAGSDTLIGGRGDDKLEGGAGDDRFVFNVGDSNGQKHDIIEKFNVGPLEHDMIELRGWAAYGVTDFASLQSHMFNKGGDVWIVGHGTAQKPAAGTDIIVLDHTKLADLHIGDFLLV